MLSDAEVRRYNTQWIQLAERLRGLGFDFRLPPTDQIVLTGPKQSKDEAAKEPEEVTNLTDQAITHQEAPALKLEPLVKRYGHMFRSPSDAVVCIQTILFIGFDLGRGIDDQIGKRILDSMIRDGQLIAATDDEATNAVAMVAEITGIGAKLRRADRSN